MEVDCVFDWYRDGDVGETGEMETKMEGVKISCVYYPVLLS